MASAGVRNAIAVLIAVSSVACAPGAGTSLDTSRATDPPRHASPKRLVAAIWGDPQTLNPTMNSSGAGSSGGVDEVSNLLHVGFADVNYTTAVEPRLGERIPSVENGLWKIRPDGRMETTFVLRTDARWHDGTPVTADDLGFTVRVGQDPEAALLRDRAYSLIESVEVLDSRTAVVHWSGPYIFADSLFSAGTVPFPRHILGAVFSANKAEFLAHPYWTSEFIGTGPFRLREFERGSHLVLQANEAYLLGRPKIDEIEIKFLPDANAVAANILAGLVDVTLVGQGTLSIEQALQVRDQWKEGTLTPVLSGAVGMFPQFINPNPPIILEVQFRRALLMAIDRQLLVDSLQAGLSTIAHTNFTPQNPEFKDIQSYLVRYDYDPRRAAQMIEELGYVRGADGFFRDGAGQRLNVEVRSTPGREVNEDVTLISAEHWQRLGIGVDTVIMPLQRNQDREYRSTRPGFEVVGQPDDVIRLHSKEIPTAETRWIGDNRPRYANAELDALIERYYVTIPRAERVHILGQYLHHVTDRVVMLSFFYEAGPLMTSNRLRNVTTAPTWNVHAWELR